LGSFRAVQKNTVAIRLERNQAAVFLGFGFVSAQLQGYSNLRLRQSLAKTPKILAPNGYSIF
jgi:hypothetical protein